MQTKKVDSNTLKELNFILGTEDMCTMAPSDVRARMKTVLQSVLNTSDFDNSRARVGKFVTNVDKDALWIKVETDILGLSKDVKFKCFIDCSKGTLYDQDLKHRGEFLVKDKRGKYTSVVIINDLTTHSFNTAYSILQKVRIKDHVKTIEIRPHKSQQNFV